MIKANVETIVMNKKKLSREDFMYLLYKSTNKTDFLTLNYIEKSIIDKNGPDFVSKSKDKIEVIVSLILNDDISALHSFYSHAFDSYMAKVNNNPNYIISFNLLFTALIHISLKIVRKSAFEKK